MDGTEDDISVVGSDGELVGRVEVGANDGTIVEAQDTSLLGDLDVRREVGLKVEL